MRWPALIVLILASCVATAEPADVAAVPPQAFMALCYHDVRDDVREDADPNAVDSAALVAQFAWLRENGYTPVSLDEIIAARQGRRPLPRRAVLLTFDDAYRSFYTRVYPLLREFRFPAVVGVVGAWIDTPPGGRVQYEDTRTVPRDSFPTWGELREMAASGLVELASHSYDLHHGVLANPQGNRQAAATTRIYDAATGVYEDAAAWRTRVRADLARSVEVIARETGHRPRAMVWPYGSYNDELVRLAGEMGLSIGLTLGNGPNTEDVPLTLLRRAVVGHNPGLIRFIGLLRGPERPDPMRVVQVDLDSIYSGAPTKQEGNLSVLLDRIQALKPSHVYLRAFADTDGDGLADAAYFPSRHLPLRADLFNRVAWQLLTRTGVKVFALVPVTAFRLPAGHPLAGRVVPGAGEAAGRLSLFDPEVRTVVAEMYEDLASHASFAGLLFSDGAPAGDADDATPAALLHYNTAWGLPATIGEIRADATLEREWRRRTAAFQIAFTQQLAVRAQAFRAPLDTARSLYVEPVPDVNAEGRSSPALSAYLAAYDHVAVVVLPTAEGVRDRAARLERLVRRLAREPGARRKVVFVLSARDEHTTQGAPGDVLAREMRDLQLEGALNFGYAPDDARGDSPPLAKTAPAMSLRRDPR